MAKLSKLQKEFRKEFRELDKNEEFQKAKRVRPSIMPATPFDVEKCLEGVRRFVKNNPPRSFRS